MRRMSKIDRSVYIAPGSHIIGDVTIGKSSGVWYNAVIRADTDRIVIGENTNIQDNAVLHVDEGHPMQIGDGVSIGHGAVLHGCSIGSNTVIGMGAIVLNDAKIGKNCMIGAGAMVPGGMEVPDGHIAFGSPARVRREASPEDILENRRNAEVYTDLARKNREREEG